MTPFDRKETKVLEIIFGFIAGNITGLGMGGGTVLILLLSIFMQLDQHIAQATNLLFFIPTSIASIVTNIKQKNINMNFAKTVSIFGIIGAVIGATISQRVSSYILRRTFALFILIIAFYEIYGIYKSIKEEQNTNNKNIKIKKKRGN